MTRRSSKSSELAERLRCFVFFLEGLDLRLERDEIGVFLGEHLADGAAGIDGVGVDIRQDFAFRETLVLRVDAGGGDDRIEHVLLILAVHDGEAGAEAGGLGVAAEHAIADGMEGAAPEAGEIVRDQGGDALEHFARGLVGEGEEKDVGGADAILDEICDAIGQGAGLAAASAGDHQRGPGRGGDGAMLLRIELPRRNRCAEPGAAVRLSVYWRLMGLPLFLAGPNSSLRRLASSASARRSRASRSTRSSM